MESGIPTFWRMICKLAGKLIKRFGEIKGEAPYRADPCWCDASMSHARSYMLSGPPRCLINPVSSKGSCWGAARLCCQNQCLLFLTLALHTILESYVWPLSNHQNLHNSNQKPLLLLIWHWNVDRWLFLHLELKSVVSGVQRRYFPMRRYLIPGETVDTVDAGNEWWLIHLCVHGVELPN